jgi:NAD(P) transhydrogenase subunit beta
MIGMAIAIATTLFLASPGLGGLGLIVVGIAIGGGTGAYIAQRIPMTAMPQLVAGFHSLVGLAAVLVAAAALYTPSSFGYRRSRLDPRPGAGRDERLALPSARLPSPARSSLCLKLDGRMSGKPIMLPARHVLNAGLGIALVVLVIMLVMTRATLVFWLIVILSLVLGVLIIIPIGGADMPVVVSMLNSYSGWAAAGIGFTLGNTR